MGLVKYFIIFCSSFPLLSTIFKKVEEGVSYILSNAHFSDTWIV